MSTASFQCPTCQKVLSVSYYRAHTRSKRCTATVDVLQQARDEAVARAERAKIARQQARRERELALQAELGRFQGDYPILGELMAKLFESYRPDQQQFEDYIDDIVERHIDRDRYGQQTD